MSGFHVGSVPKNNHASRRDHHLARAHYHPFFRIPPTFICFASLLIQLTAEQQLSV